MTTRRTVGVLAVVLSAVALSARVGEAAGPAARDARSPANLTVSARDGLLSLRAAQCPWDDILTEISRATGAVIRARPEPEGLVTTSLGNVPMEEVLRRLLGHDRGLIFRYRNAADAFPAEVWVVGRAADAATTSYPTTAIAPVPAAAATAAPAAMPPAAVLADLHGVDAEVSRRAAALLGRGWDEAALVALQQVAAGDEAPENRASAAASLARIGTPRALDALRRALADPDAMVRERTVAVLATQGHEPALTLLRDALSDPEESVRAAAAAALDRAAGAGRRQR